MSSPWAMEEQVLDAILVGPDQFTDWTQVLIHTILFHRSINVPTARNPSISQESTLLTRAMKHQNRHNKSWLARHRSRTRYLAALPVIRHGLSWRFLAMFQNGSGSVTVEQTKSGSAGTSGCLRYAHWSQNVSRNAAYSDPDFIRSTTGHN
jgi:hypothetical protein